MSNSIEIGKLLPQACDLEEAVLGAIMLERNAINEVIGILQPESFYKEIHGIIYEAIKQLFSSSQPIDILTVTNQLRANGDLERVGGPAYISSLTNRIASAANLEYHSRIVQQKYMQRELIATCTKAIKESYNDETDVFELINDQYRQLDKINNTINTGANFDKHKYIEEWEQRNEKLKEGEVITGIRTHLKALDLVTKGWQNSDMIVIAARPAMGKTTLVLQMALNISVYDKKPVGLFSLEMSGGQLMNKANAALTEMNLDAINNKSIGNEFKIIKGGFKQIADAPLYIDDTPALTLLQLRSKAFKLKHDHKIELMIIDYIQLMSSNLKGANREQQISEISRGIKQIAKELNIPVIALSQLSRSVETRGGDKKPMLSDLRESGAIEQDADIVAFIYRPEYYNITDLENISTSGLMQLLIEKHRNGALADVNLTFIPEKSRVVNFIDPNSYSAKAEAKYEKIKEQESPKKIKPNTEFDDTPF